MTTTPEIIADSVKYLATTAAIFLGWKALLAYWSERLRVFGCEVVPGLKGVTPKEEERTR